MPELDVLGERPAPANGTPAEGGSGKVGDEEAGDVDKSVGSDDDSAGATPP